MSITPKQISGSWYYVGGVPIAGATLVITLSQSAVLNDNSGSVAPMSYEVTLDANGSIPDSAAVYDNADLLPTGTYYTFYVKNVLTDTPAELFGPVSAQITGTAPINLNTIPPLSNVVQPTPAPSAFGPLTVVQPTGTNLHVVVDSDGGGSVTAEIEGHGGAILDAAPGSAIPTNALMIGGSDGTNLRAIATDATGQIKALIENFPSTQAVTQSTSPWVVQIGATGIFSHSLNQDGSGNIGINIENSPSVSVTNFPVTQPVSIASTISTSAVPSSTATPVTPNVQQALTGSAEVKASAGNLYSIRAVNTNTYPVWVFVYNTTSAPTIGSATNLIYQFCAPASSATPGGFIDNFDYPIAASSGIYVAVSQSPTSASAPATGLTVTTTYL